MEPMFERLKQWAETFWDMYRLYHKDERQEYFWVYSDFIKVLAEEKEWAFY